MQFTMDGVIFYDFYDKTLIFCRLSPVKLLSSYIICISMSAIS
ncbi:hypothetical protein DK45_4305 [Bordetella bronchiseptica]|nr:hypothetical protein DK45_4305 [Bordetella bronchiseptica]